MIVNRTTPKSLSAAGWMIVAMLTACASVTPVRGDGPDAAPAVPSTSAPAPQAVDDNTRKIIEALLAAAQDSNDEVRVESSNAIVQFGAEAVPVLIEALEREKTAQTAGQLLGALGVDAVDPLLASLGSRNASIRESALLTLRNIFTQKTGIGASDPGLFGGGGGYGGAPMGMEGGGIPGGPSQDTLDLPARLFAPVAKATADENVAVRRAATTLLNYVAQAKPAGYSPQPFVARVSDDDANVRLMAAQALMALRPADDAVVKALAGLIGDRDEKVQATALMALAAIGPDAKGATDAVLAALKSANPQLRVMAARALGAMQAPQPQPGAASGFYGGFPGGVAPAAEGAGNVR